MTDIEKLKYEIDILQKQHAYVNKDMTADISFKTEQLNKLLLEELLASNWLTCSSWNFVYHHGENFVSLVTQTKDNELVIINQEYYNNIVKLLNNVHNKTLKHDQFCISHEFCVFIGNIYVNEWLAITVYTDKNDISQAKDFINKYYLNLVFDTFNQQIEDVNKEILNLSTLKSTLESIKIQFKGEK